MPKYQYTIEIIRSYTVVESTEVLVEAYTEEEAYDLVEEDYDCYDLDYEWCNSYDYDYTKRVIDTEVLEPTTIIKEL